MSANPSVDDLSSTPAQLFEQAVEQTRMALCLVDPFTEDQPIVFANRAFVELTGYDRDEIVGNNCRFLQGPETDPEAPKRIREALEARRVAVIDILNYRKDGTPFWNALHVGPIFDEAGELTHYYGSQWDITELLTERETAARSQHVVEELKHRTGNLFAVVRSIVTLSARQETDVAVVRDRILDRIQALSLAHEATLMSGEDNLETADLRNLFEKILRPYRRKVGGQIDLVGDPVTLPSRYITPLGLTLHELATNALKYGALREDGGDVRLSWSVDDQQLKIDWSETLAKPNGDTAVPPKTEGTGSRMMDGVIRGLRGTFERAWRPTGLKASISVPLDEGTQPGL